MGGEGGDVLMPKLHDDDPMGWIDSNWVSVVLIVLTFLIIWGLR